MGVDYYSNQIIWINLEKVKWNQSLNSEDFYKYLVSNDIKIQEYTEEEPFDEEYFKYELSQLCFFDRQIYKISRFVTELKSKFLKLLEKEIIETKDLPKYYVGIQVARTYSGQYPEEYEGRYRAVTKWKYFWLIINKDISSPWNIPWEISDTSITYVKNWKILNKENLKELIADFFNKNNIIFDF